MSDERSNTVVQPASAAEVVIADHNPNAEADESVEPKEIGGRSGPDPTRYGDWESKGRCIDF